MGEDKDFSVFSKCDMYCIVFFQSFYHLFKNIWEKTGK